MSSEDKYKNPSSDELTVNPSDYGIAGYRRDANGNYSMDVGYSPVPNPIDSKYNINDTDKLVDKSSVDLDPVISNITDKAELKKIRDGLIALNGNNYNTPENIAEDLGKQK